MEFRESVERAQSSVIHTIEGSDLKPVIDRVRELLYNYHPAGYGTLAELGWCSAVEGSRWRAVVKRAASCE